MTREAIALAALCACAAGCGSAAATTDETGKPRGEVDVAGGERVASRPVIPDLARTDPEVAADISALPRTGTAIVHDADDASAESPLPSMDDALDLREPAAHADVRVQLCPVGIEGLDARAIELPDGPALVLTATGESAISELRARMQRFADALARRGDDVPDLGGLPSADDVRYVVIPGGARLEARTDDGARADRILGELAEDAAALREGRCPLSLQAEA